MLLYRPIGYRELELIAESNYTSFPPRLPSQPIFYPVLNLEYAIQIARDWNTTDPNSEFAGFVTKFAVDETYISQYEIQIVGSSRVHQELWVPAENLDEFNRHLIGKIELIDAYYGDRSSIEIDLNTNLPLIHTNPIATDFN